MRRALGAMLAAALVGGAVTLALGAGDSNGGSGEYRVDAIFANAGFLVPGQDVRIAGAIVGSVRGITLTADRQARVEMRIEEGFAPFQKDADCTVQPQSLIGERFVQCSPGTAATGPLPDRDGVATVPARQTHSPVDLDVVLSTFRGPAAQRLGLLLSSLGAGTAARGEDLDTAIRRANPALQQTANALRVINESREQLRPLITGADDVIGKLAERRRSIQRFIRTAGDLTTTTASRRRELEITLRELPGLLDEVSPYLDEVTRATRQGGPALDDLRAAIAPTQRLLDQVDGLTSRTLPTVREVRTTVAQARQLLPDAKPVLSRLNRTARSMLPASRLLGDLVASSRTNGALEGLQTFVYYAVAATARFDANSHLLGAFPVADQVCSAYATTPVPACNANFASLGTPAAAPGATSKREASAAGKKPANSTPAPAAGPAAGAQSSAVPAAPGRPARPILPTPVPKAVGDAIDALNGLLGGAPRPKPGPTTEVGPPAGDESLLDFLLG